ncbi:type I polyketide synthase [Actinoallomurus sp. NPDC050550]|uniref:type I polyketide synthase n=1 Tax=Actinoallomurus sp. NPDC050550 TaxID=3154937 RepID=UPI00340212D0
MRPGSVDAIRTWIVDWLTEHWEPTPDGIDGHEPFGRYGVDSLTLTRLSEALERALERPVSPALPWKYRSPQALAAHLMGETTTVLAHAPPADVVTGDEPIAVIGLSCRFPGTANADAFWHLLSSGEDAITDVPADRWHAADLPGAVGAARGGFLTQVDRFDPEFFGISPREAAHIDPQQRLMLELAWEALEDAGVPPDDLGGSGTGVFVGAMWNEYGASRWGQAGLIGPHTTAGNDLSIVPARVSYTLGLCGPSMAVNTACSSSLVAVHLAAQSLLRGECDLALAGGVNLMLDPNTMLSLDRLGALSPDGRSKAFDGSADGYGRGEGGGLIVLKRLSRALADGDPVHCVIRGGAVNNDGGGNSLTAPSPQAQEAVLRQAYARAGVRPADVQYVEAHGTGTRLGDPIEAEALSAVLCAGRPRERALRIGSVKANIGHLEAAAGIAGVIKVALAMRHRVLPPSVRFERPNPHIPFEEWALRVQREPEDWPGDEEGRLLAGVSGFGFGGTNCHLVLEGLGEEAAWLVPVEAATPEALRSAVRDLASAVTGPGPWPPRLAPPAGDGRRHRLALTARSRDDLIARADDFLAGRAHPGVRDGRPGGERPKTVFAFGGQGAQWPAMGVRLLREEPVFRSALRRCAEAMRPYADWSLLQVLSGDDEAWLESTPVVQPAIFAVQVALAELWRSWGVEPDAVVGMSMGEVAAAHVSGVLDLDDAARLMCVRSRIAGRLRGRGGMAVAECSAAEARAVLDEHPGRVWVAGEAGPRSTVLSGDRDALGHVLTVLEAGGVRCGRIRVDYASHSPFVDDIRDELTQALAWLRPRDARVPFHSSVNGGPLDGRRLTAEHWVRTERDPWLFSSTVRGLLDEGHDVFVDLDPHPVLVDAIRQHVRPDTVGPEGGQAARYDALRDGPGRPEVLVLPSLRRGDRGRATPLESLGALYASGAAVDLQRVDGVPVDDVASVRIAVVTARTPEALRDAARALADRFREGGDAPVGDLCHTSAVRRTHHEHRLTVVGRTAEEIAGSLRVAADGEPRAGTASGRVSSGDRPPPVFVFSGQGSQWAGMGRDLLDREPVFRRVVESCDEALRPLAGWSLLAELAGTEDAGRLDRTSVAQPALFAVEVGLAALWRSWGITPAAVVGHSVGEVAAAHVAGVIGLEDAIRIVHHRGRLMERAAGLGRMGAAELPRGRARNLVAGYGGRLAIAAVNDPGSVVFSGAAEALADLLRRLREDGVHCRDLRVDYAFHSGQMTPFHDELARALDESRPGRARLPIYSTVTGEEIKGPELDGAYWADNVRDTVRFADAMESALSAGHRTFLEVGPHPVLVANIEECLAHAGVEGRAVGSLRRQQDGSESLLRSVGALFADGHPVDWERLAGDWGRRVPLPAYPWQRRRYWLTPPWSGGASLQPSWSDRGHPQLGSSLTSSVHPGTTYWQQRLSVTRSPFLTALNVRGETVLSAAAYLEMASSAGARLWPGQPVEVTGLTFERLLTISPEDEPTVQAVAEEQGPGRVDFQVSSKAGDSWVRHCHGVVRHAPPDDRRAAEEPIDRIRNRCSEHRPGIEHYRRLSESGLEFDEPLRGVRDLWLGADEALGRIALPAEPVSPSGHRMDPAMLDSCLQVAAALCDASDGGSHMITSVDRFRLDGPGTGEVWAHVRLRPEDGRERVADLRLVGVDGREVGVADGLRLRPLPPSTPTRVDAGDEVLYALEWRGTEQPSAVPGRAGTVLVLADRGGSGHALAAALRARGRRCVLAVLDRPYEETDPDVIHLDPGEPGAVGALLSAAFPEPPSCVVHLGALDTPPTEAARPGHRRQDATLAAGRVAAGVLHTAQALAAAGRRDTPRLWLVTRGAQAAGSGPVSAAQAPVWGLGRVIATEHPELACTRVDLDPGLPADEAAVLCREVLADGPETDVAFRDGGRRVLRLARTPPAGPADAGRRNDARPAAGGTHLVVGGSLPLIAALADRPTAGDTPELLVVHREAAAEAITAAMAGRVGVRLVRADVSDPGDAAAVLAGIGDLRGVVYAGSDGIVDDAAVGNLTADRLTAGLASTMAGAWNLHALTADRELDYFVLWSSAAPLLGFPGQAVRAAGDAFLDALAAHRRLAGLRATGVGCGPVAPDESRGRAIDGGNRLAAQGVEEVTTADCARALRRFSAAGPGSLAVLRLNARHWVQTHPGAAASPLLSDLLAEPPAIAADGASLRRELAGLREGERRSRLEDHLRGRLALTLQQDPARLDRTTPFQTMGLESLMAVEYRNRLEAVLGTRLPVALLFTCSTIAALADHILTELDLGAPSGTASADAGDAGETGVGPGAAPGADAAFNELDIEAMSDEEAERLLLRLIEAEKTDE